MPPGVYVEEAQTPVQPTIGLGASVPAIVGPAIGYRTHTEAVVLAGVANSRLTKLGVDQASVVVKDAQNTVIPGTDYTLTVGSGADADAGTTTDNTTDIKRSGASNILDGSTVYVSYHYTDTDYLTPVRINDYDDAKDLFGEPFDAAGNILSPLSLAAKFALANGAPQLVLAPASGSASAVTTAALVDAYNRLVSFYDVNIVVPLPVGITGTDLAPADVPTIGTDLAQALLDALNDSVYRVGLLGVEKSVTMDPAGIATGIDSERVVLMWPNRINYFNGLINQTIELSGYYLAAAAAGRLAVGSPQIPLTHKQIVGFNSIPPDLLNTMTKVTKNAWSAAGVAVAEVDRQRRLRVRHGTTTDRSSIYTRELSLVRAKDGMVRIIKDAVDASELIGSPIDLETPVRVKGLIIGCLERAKNSGLIVDYLNVKSRQKSSDPSEIEVKFEYKPSYPLNYITVVFSVNADTGDVAPLLAA